MGRTLQGTTVTFGTLAITGRIVRVEGLEESVEVLDDSALDSEDHMESIPGDLKDPAPFEIEFQYDQDGADPDVGVVDDITITYPLLTGQTTAATLAGTGFLTRRKAGNAETNAGETAKAMVSFKFDGKTGPTRTAGS